MSNMCSFLHKKKAFFIFLIIYLFSYLFFGVNSLSADSERDERIVSGILDRDPYAGDDPAATAQSCLAFVSIAERGNAVALDRARVFARRLISMAQKKSSSVVGWGYNSTRRDMRCTVLGSIDAFNDGTCNPPSTSYMFQTGYAISCLARTALLTRDAELLLAAREAADASWEIGTRLNGCHDCFFYWYSYSPNDVGRFVRNTNVLMGMGLAWLWRASGDARYLERAIEITNTEKYENSLGNFGYFGTEDIAYKKSPTNERGRIENHISHIILGLEEMYDLIGDDSIKKLNDTIVESWLHCSNEFCKRQICKLWTAPAKCGRVYTFAPCRLRERNSMAKAACSMAIDAIGEEKMQALAIFSYMASHVILHK